MSEQSNNEIARDAIDAYNEAAAANSSMNQTIRRWYGHIKEEQDLEKTLNCEYSGPYLWHSVTKCNRNGQIEYHVYHHNKNGPSIKEYLTIKGGMNDWRIVGPDAVRFADPFYEKVVSLLLGLPRTEGGIAEKWQRNYGDEATWY